MDGFCNIVGTKGSKDPTAIFKRTLHEEHRHLCDTCPYKDCHASQAQMMRMRTIEDDYREAFMPECDRHVLAREEELKEMRRTQRRNPTGRKRGRPRKERQQDDLQNLYRP